MEQFSGLRKFLLHNNIDPDLSIRVTRFLKHTFTMKHKALSKDGKVAILDMLSKSLHEELEVQRHNECLQASGFLHQLLLLVDVGQTGNKNQPVILKKILCIYIYIYLFMHYTIV